MKLEELEELAEQALNRWNNSILPKPPGAPSFKFLSPKIIEELLPNLKPRLLGQTRGYYCYLVDAEEFKKALVYFKSEF